MPPPRPTTATKYGGYGFWVPQLYALAKKTVGKVLTKGAVIAYNLRLQGCPCMGKALKQTAHTGNSTGGMKNEAYFPAQEASAQPRAWFPAAHEHQERPQGPGPSSCQGPQEPDGLIFGNEGSKGLLTTGSAALFSKLSF